MSNVSCGQVNPMNAASSQLSAMNANAQLSKGKMAPSQAHINAQLNQNPIVSQQNVVTNDAMLMDPVNMEHIQLSNYVNQLSLQPSVVQPNVSVQTPIQSPLPTQESTSNPIFHQPTHQSQQFIPQQHMQHQVQQHHHQHQQQQQQMMMQQQQQQQQMMMQQQQQQQQMMMQQQQQVMMQQQQQQQQKLQQQQQIRQTQLLQQQQQQKLQQTTQKEQQLSGESMFSLLQSQQSELDMVEPVVDENFTSGIVQELRNADNDKFKNSKFLKFIDRLNNGEIKFQDNEVVEVDRSIINDDDDISHLMRDNSDEYLQSLYNDNSDDLLAQLRNQAHGGSDAGDEVDVDLADYQPQQFTEEDFLAHWQDQFQHINWEKDEWDAKNDETLDYLDGLQENEDNTRPDYKFLYEDVTVANDDQTDIMNLANDAFERGLLLFEEGNISGAIHEFETSVRYDADNTEAWRWLGQSLAQNDEDSRAIDALRTCLYLDPYHLASLLMLGVSHTNNFNGKQALNYLKTWLLNNPEYLDLDKTALENIEDNQSVFMTGELHKEVTRMFQAAAQVNPADADIWTVLGVLYHITSDFELATNAFKEAVKLRPDNPELWNKLGATLANAGHNSQAEEPYLRALELRPGYVRSQSNLGICYYNQNMHDRAVDVFLDLLENNSDHLQIWSLLRMSLSIMEEATALEHAKKQDIQLIKQALGK